MCGMKNHTEWLKNYPSNLRTLNCIDTVGAAAIVDAGNTNQRTGNICSLHYCNRSVSRIYISSGRAGDGIYLDFMRYLMAYER